MKTKEKKKEERERRKNNPSFHSCSSERETTSANVVQGYQNVGCDIPLIQSLLVVIYQNASKHINISLFGK